ncbi:conserved exported hypothetical protein [Pseudomonas sp. 9AZ]|nr:conserved exported hypothetical protein [Pseudomonas sp. 9AZ]
MVLLCCSSVMVAIAALAPDTQKLTDLEVMVDFARQHREVAARLRFIDVEKSVIAWTEGCEAHFSRPTVMHFPDWAGPQPRLKYDRSNCELEP